MNSAPPSLQQLNRTFIGSVLFIDIVGYSRRTVPDQLEMKEVFNELLTEAVQTVAPAERIMVDTGDGAGVAFLGDPEDALFAALSLRDAIAAGKVTVGDPGFVRMGINLGPLKMVRDINGHTNMIGDGVNDAQRVMSFSEPGQVMVSHSYFDIISRFSRDYTKLFVYEGTRQDKHVREHEVYRFGPADGAEKLTEQLNEKMRSRMRQPDASAARDQSASGFPNTVWPSMKARKIKAEAPAGTATATSASSGRKSGSRYALIATAIGAVALTGAVWSWTSKPAMKEAEVQVASATPEDSPIRQVAATAAAASSSASAKQDAGAQKPVYLATQAGTAATETDKIADQDKAAAKSEAKPADKAIDKTAEKAAPKTAEKPADKVADKQPADKPAEKHADTSAEKNADRNNGRQEASAGKPGTVKLAILPWGEVYVDGSKRGVSPPLKTLSLAPGKHRIEVRNGDAAPQKQTIEVKSNAETTLQVVF